MRMDDEEAELGLEDAGRLLAPLKPPKERYSWSCLWDEIK